MARCLLYANEVLLGWADLVPTDPSMGGVSGAFHPTENYRAIQATIWNAMAHSDYGKHHTPAGIAAYAAKDALGLRICTETKEPLEQVGPIWLDDFTNQLPIAGRAGRLQQLSSFIDVFSPSSISSPTCSQNRWTGFDVHDGPENASKFCPKANAMKLSSIKKNLSLDATPLIQCN